MRWVFLGVVTGAGGCASVEYRVPSWEVQRLTELPPEVRGDEVRVIPAGAVVPPPPPAPVADVDPPPPSDVDVDVEFPPSEVVVAVSPRVVVVPPHPIVRARPVGAPPTGGGRSAAAGWRAAPSASHGFARAAPVGGHHASATHVRSGGGGGHLSSGAGAAAGAVALVGLVAIMADAAITAAQADAARAYNGWVAVDPGHLIRLFYKGNLGRIVPLASLGPWDLTGLEDAMLLEDDGHVEPIRRVPVAAPPPPPRTPPPIAARPTAPNVAQEQTQATPAAPQGSQPTAPEPPVSPTPPPPPAPVPQSIDRESP
ncbi:MAG TPA: hypothetical protein VHG72_13470 [Polyangia bacterium]|nr:hypothetical protein [Polyangia bacterium]